MKAAFEPPSQSAWMYDEQGHRIGHMSLGGPELLMPVGEKVIRFEMHRYFGPIPLRKDGVARERVQKGFYEAFEKWDTSGRMIEVETGLCVIDAEQS